MEKHIGFDKKSSSLRSEDMFEDCLDLSLEIISIEKEHLKRARLVDLMGLMRDTFGETPLSFQIVRGLQASFDAYIRTKPGILHSKFETINKEATHNMQLLRG